MAQLALDFDAPPPPDDEPYLFIGPLLIEEAYDKRQRMQDAQRRLVHKWRIIRAQEKKVTP